MIDIGKHRVYLGDFHTHWYWDAENPTLYLAGMDKLGLDFVCHCDGRKRAEEADRLARAYGSRLRFFAAQEVGDARMHIAAMLNEDEDGSNLRKPLSDSPDGDPTVEETLRRVNTRSRLTLLAHPGHNWSAAWDGHSFQPLIDLYRNGFIDGFQIDKNQSYAMEVLYADGHYEIPVVTGMDVHCCTPLSPLPPYLYGRDIEVFHHITPCFPGTTLVFAEENSEEAIVAAVKACRSCVFNMQTMKLTGPPALLQILQEGDFLGKFTAHIARHEAVSIQVGVGAVVGDPLDIRAEAPAGTESVTVTHPSATGGLWDAVTTQGATARIETMPPLLERADFYFPLVVGVDDQRYTYGVLARQPILAEMFECVEGPRENRRYYIDCELTNNTPDPRDMSLELACPDLQVLSPTASLALAPEAKAIHRFEIARPTRPGFEYDASLRWTSGKAGFTQQMPVSFVPCRYLSPGEDPWQVIPEECIIIDDLKQTTRDWQGPDDLSLRVNMRWDERAFYMFAEVTDDVFSQLWTGWEAFWGDSIQATFSAARHRQRGYDRVHEHIYSKTSLGMETLLWYTPATGNKQLMELLPEADLDIERNEKDKQTLYRLSIPWEKMAPFTPQVGAQYQYMLACNDHDARGGRHVGFWGGNLTHNKDMSCAHTITLVW